MVTCLLGDIGIGLSAGISIFITPDAPAAGTTITNTATASADPTELIPADNTDTADADVLAAADLAVSKSDSVDPAFAGVPFTYTVTVDNAGPNAATSVVLTDTLPVGVAFSSATPDQGSCVEAASVVTCTLGTIGPGGSVDVAIVVIAGVSVENTTVTNTATVTSAVADPVSGDNATSEDTDIIPSADLNITKSDDADPALVGDVLTYTVTVLNQGVSAATNVVVTDVLPSGVAFVSATPGQGSCSESSGTITCPLGAMAALASVDIVIVVTPGVSTGNTTITNNASVVADQADPDVSDDSVSEDTDIDSKTDLALTKTAAPDPVLAGNALTYTLTVTNNGPSDSTGSTVTDALPSGVSFNAGASSPGCSEAGGTVTCAVGAVATGGFSVLTVVVDLDSSLADGSTLTNNATVAANEADTVAANDSDNTTVTVDAQADLSISKVDSADPATAGSALVYTIGVTNQGPSDAQSVVVTDVLAAGLSHVSATASQGSCSETAGTVTCTLSTIVDGASATVTLTVDVDPGVADGSTIPNTATVASATVDPDGANNSAAATTDIETSADIAVTKSDLADPVVAGTNLTYTVAVSNNGPSDAQSVQVVDLLPFAVAFVSYSIAGGSGGESCAFSLGTLTCDLGTIFDAPLRRYPFW